LEEGTNKARKNCGKRTEENVLETERKVKLEVAAPPGRVCPRNRMEGSECQ